MRAGNGNGQWSGWRNSAPIDPYTPEPTPTPTPAPAPPDAPASVTVTRADGTVTASGYAVSGATKYHVTYSSDDKQSWTAASDSYTDSSITITGVDNAKTYVVGVRAVQPRRNPRRRLPGHRVGRRERGHGLRRARQDGRRF